MRKRHILIAAVVVPAVLLAGAIAFVLSQDPDEYRDELAALLTDAAGHPVILAGPVSLAWRPVPAITAADVQVEAEGARVRLGQVTVTVNPRALLARKLRAREIIVAGLLVDLQEGGPAPGTVVLPDPADLPVDDLTIEGATLSREGALLVELARVRVREADDPAGARVELRGQAGGRDLRVVARVRVDGSLLALDALKVDTFAGTVEGQLDVRLDGERPRVSGVLSSGALAFPAASRGSTGGRLIPKVAVDLAPLEALDADLRVRVGRLTVADFRVSEVSAPVGLRGGALEVRASGVLASGPVSALFRAGPAGLSLDLSLREANAGDALVMAGVHAAERGGRLAVNAALAAAGADTHALVASLDGRLAVDARRLTLRAGAAEVAGADVFASVMRALRGGDNDRVGIECAVARFAVRDGVLHADRSIGAQSRAMNILGGGRISLADERLDLALRPWPREGLGLSATAVVGTVAISGPLAAPEAGLTGEAAWRGGATAGAALLTGGLSLIAQGLLERARGDTPCQDAANVAPGPAGDASGATGAAAGDAEPPTSEGLVEGAVRGIGQAIEGVFGAGDGTRGSKADR